MGKAFGAFMRFLVILAMLCLVGYNTWQVEQLREEVNALKRSGHTMPGKNSAATEKTAAGKSATDSSQGDPTALLLAAKTHAESAREHLSRKEYAEASHEMALSAEAAQKASSIAGTESADRFASLKKAIGSVQAEADSLMKSHGGADNAR